jgi:hypothetical protein
MNNVISSWRFLVLGAFLVLNAYWIGIALLPEPNVKASAALTSQTSKAPKLNEQRSPIPSKPAATIQVVRAPVSEVQPIPSKPKHKVEVPKQVAKVLKPSGQKPGKKALKKDASKNEPRLVGFVSVDYLALEKMVMRQGGAVYLYDLNSRSPIRQIKHGVLVTITPPAERLSSVSHNLTGELDPALVASWVKEQRQLNPKSAFVVVAKFPAQFQSGFERFAKSIAAESNLQYESIDEVQFSFGSSGLVLTNFRSKDGIVPINRVFSS